jgi:hypothetical protein
MARDELLVGGDNRLSCLESAADPLPRRVETADQLDQDVRIGGQHLIDIRSPAHIRQPVSLFPFDIPIAHGGKPQALRWVFRQDAGNGTANCSKTHDGHIQGL